MPVRRSRLPATPFAIVAVATVVLAGCGADAADGAGSGAGLYAENCASCHGGDVRGTLRGPSLLSIVYEPGHHGDDSFRAAVRNGVAPHHWEMGAMPPIAGLDAAEVDLIIAHVRALQQREGFEPYPPD